MGSDVGKRALRRGILLLALTGCTLLFGTSTALGASHELLYSFGPDGTEATSFSHAGSSESGPRLTFQDASRRLYLLNSEEKALWGFDASAPPAFPLVPPFDPLALGSAPARGLAVDSSSLSSAGNVYFNTDAGGGQLAINGFNSKGEALAGFPFTTTLQGSDGGPIAVDSAGRFWLGRSNAGATLSIFLPRAIYPFETLDAGTSSRSLAFDANDDLYLGDLGATGVRKYSAASNYTVPSTVDPASDFPSLAVDHRNHHLYIAYATKVKEYDADGALIEEFATGIAGANYTGIAIDPANHFVYVADHGAGLIRVFAPGAAYPDLALGDPAPLENTSATLHGSVNPEGSALTKCQFEWVTETAFKKSGGFGDLSSGGSAPCNPAAGSIPSSGDTAVSADISGLGANTIYRYRLIAANAANAAGPSAFGGSFTTSGPPIAETTGSPVPGPTSAVLSGRLDPERAPTDYHFEYTTKADFGANGFANAKSTPDVVLAGNEVQSVRKSNLGPFKLGFGADTTADILETATAAQVQAALEALPSIGAGNVSVAGGPGEVGSRYIVTFTGALADTDVPRLFPIGLSTFVETAIPGGFGDRISLIAARVGGLAPGTAYRYRLLAENGNPDGEAVGRAMTLTTPAAMPLTNPDFPHPPGNDRAYEQVSAPDSGGNPALFAFAFSAKGDRAIYQISGGAPVSDSGTAFSQLLAVRPVGDHPTSSWEQVNLTPRSLFEPTAPDWFFLPASDLGRVLGFNENGILPAKGQVQNLWRITPPGGPYEDLARVRSENSSQFFDASDDLSRAVMAIQGDLDPAHPADSTVPHLYDVSDGAPHLLDLLPGGAAACGVDTSVFAIGGRPYGLDGFYLGKRHWVSADGTRVFFPSQGEGPCGEGGGAAPVQIYMREIEAAQTEPISLLPGGGTVAGPACSAAFLRSTATAAFFWTQSDLDLADSAPGSCANAIPTGARDGDVYRYEFAGGSLECLTCIAPHADVSLNSSNSSKPGGPLNSIGVSEDGSAVYFDSPNRLLAGAAASGTYRLDVAGDTLAYVAPDQQPAGDALGTQSAVSADGSVLVFASADPTLNPQGGDDNGATLQYYRYDHADRSLICVSCPPDGSPPLDDVHGVHTTGGLGQVSSTTTYNGSPLSADGDVFAFDSTVPLVGADQNTDRQDPNDGRDVYEWRGGRALLVSDGLSNWPNVEQSPQQAGVSPDGKNIFFFATAQYTPDALDGYRRLYDARLGGGIVFPRAQPPCPLDACQGTPKGAPAEQPPGTSEFHGAGNPPQASCPRQRVRRHGRCVRKPRAGKHHRHSSRAVNHNRRTAR